MSEEYIISRNYEAEEAEVIRSLGLTEADLIILATNYLVDMNLMKTARRCGLPYATVWRVMSTTMFELALQSVKDACEDAGAVITKNRIAFKLWEIANDEIEARVSERNKALDSLTKLLGYDPATQLNLNHTFDPKVEITLAQDNDHPIDITPFANVVEVERDDDDDV